MRVPICLLLDDGGPVHPCYFLRPYQNVPLLIRNQFTRNFFEVCAAQGVRGKFTVLPMPSCLGRIDRQLNYVPAGHLRGFLDAVRRGVGDRFDISPEFLTHTLAYDVKKDRYLNVLEDFWADHASAGEIADYLAFALRILKRVGLPANGVTNPFYAGLRNEAAYAEGLGRAQWRVHRRRLTWYFLHCLGKKPPRRPWVARRDRRKRWTVVSIPANTHDAFAGTRQKSSQRAARAAADEGVDAMLTADGKRGRLRELMDKRMPMTLLNHWQGLVSDGRESGLAGLDRLVTRVKKTFGDDVQWMRCSELARLAVDRESRGQRRPSPAGRS